MTFCYSVGFLCPRDFPCAQKHSDVVDDDDGDDDDDVAFAFTVSTCKLTPFQEMQNNCRNIPHK